MGEERRDSNDVAVQDAMVATITFPVGDDEVEVDATIVRATNRTLVVELGSGAGTLALAMAPECDVVMRFPGLVVRAPARPGRRLDDVPASRQVELVVLDDDVDLADLFRD